MSQKFEMTRVPRPNMKNLDTNGILNNFPTLSKTELEKFFAIICSSTVNSPHVLQRSDSQKEGELWSIIYHLSLDDHKAVEDVRNYIVRNKIDVNCIRSDCTPLLYVCSKIQGEVTLSLVKLLFNHQADVNAKDENGCNALHLLCRYHSANTLKDLVIFTTNIGININTKNSAGYNVFHMLCCYQPNIILEDIVLIFIKQGIDLNAKAKNGFTALHFLCRNYLNGDLKRIVQLLIENKVDATTTNADKWNALHFLCRYYPNDDLIDIVALLIENGADIKQKNASGMNALECCLLNPSGQFHALFEFIKGRFLRCDFVWRAESLLDMAKLGCIYSVKWFIEQSGKYCVDIHDKSVVHYLREVCHNSWVLCRICRQKDKNYFNAMSNFEKELRLASKKPLKLEIPNFNIKCLENKIFDHSDLVVSKEKSFVVLPDFEQWEALIQLWQSNKPFDFKAIDQYVRQHSHFQCISGRTCDWCRVSDEIQTYIKALTEEIRILDRRLESSQLIGYGSSAERSKVFLPDEFDYAVLLNNFQSNIREGSFDVFYVGPDHDQVFLGSDRRCAVSSGRLLLYYGLLIEQAVRRIPWQGNIFQTRMTISETCVTLIFHHRFREFQEPLQVSVDLTIAVMAKQMVTSSSYRKELPEWCGLVNNNVQDVYLVPKRSSGGKGSQWQLSTFTLERDTLLQSDRGGTVTHVLRLLKTLVFLNQAKPGQRRLCRHTTPSSYALKTCLLTYMRDRPPPWSKKDVFRHCNGVLERFPVYSMEHGLMSFFSDHIVVYYINYASRKAVHGIREKLDRCML